MAQHDYVIANANGATVRADINNALLAISSTNSGTSEPSTIYAFMLWVDTTTNLIKLRNAANDAWITLGVSVTASNTVDINGGAIDGTAIGASSATTGAFTTLTTTDNLSIGGSNKELRFYEGSNYVGFEAPALTGDQIWILPTADGSADQVMTTDGSGNLSFSTISGTTINNNADNRVITGSGTANTLNGETGLTWDGSTFTAGGGGSFTSTIVVGAVTYTATDGTDGQVLTSDGSGNATFESVSAGGPTFKTFGTGSIMVGDDATGTISGANYNTALGIDVFASLTSGDKNTAVGYQALDATTSGEDNTAIGVDALGANTTGGLNTALGVNALRDNTTASNNTAVGMNSLLVNTTGANNTAVGQLALDANTTGATNTAVGKDALGACTTGASNTAVGVSSYYALTTGAYNVGLGEGTAGAGGSPITTGTKNICIGAYTVTSAADSEKQHVFGYSVTGSGNSTFTFGDGSTDTTCSFGGTTWSAPSDVRMKEEIETSTAGLGFINDLRPVTFKWKKEKDIPEELVSHKADSEERYKNDTVNHGFIAQEVKEVIDNHPEIKEGFDMWTEDEKDGRQRVGASALEIVLTKAIQELSAKVEDLEKQLNNKE